MSVVVDASLMFRALMHLPEDELVRRRLGRPRVVNAPQLLDAEMASILRGHLLGRKLTAARADEMWADYISFPMIRHPMAQSGFRVLELAHNLTAYDAQYVVLAEALECPLYTDDAKFAASVGHDVEIWRPSEMAR